jgi:imidazolonepropionase-like amidohydrolase
MRTLITGGRVWAGDDESLDDADVVVENGVITEVGPGLDGHVVIDVGGRALLPGLIDCHVHVVFDGLDLLDLIHTRPSYRLFRAARALERTLDAGVTTVRDAGGADAGVRDAVRDGVLRGPRMLVAIGMLSITGGHGDSHLGCGMTLSHADLMHTPKTVADSPDEVRQVVRQLLAAGADVIKVATSGGVLSENDSPRHPQFQPDELAALLAETTDAEVRVMAHAQAREGIRRAVEAGVASIEHGIYLDRELAELMAERGTFLVPTLVAPHAVIAAGEAGASIPAHQVAKAREVVEQHTAAFKHALDAGVRIAMGTDCGVHPHGRNLDELDLMARAGMKPVQVLQAATSEAADLLGLHGQVGRIAVGHAADLDAVDGNPFDFAAFGDRVALVVQAGAVVADRRQ